MIGKVNTGGASSPYALIECHYTAGYICTCTDGVREYSSKDTSGYWLFKIPSNGTWTLEAKSGYSKSVTITDANRYENVNINVPSEYQEVEYLESVGNQYISTDVYLANQLDFEIDSMTVTWQQYRRLLGIPYSFGDSKFQIRTGNSSHSEQLFTNDGQNFDMSGAQDLQKATYKKLGDILTVTVNGSVIKTTTMTNAQYINPSANILLFAGYDWISQTLKGRIFRAIFKHDGLPIATYYPCYRKSDNVAGMYDVINDVFKINAGSGSFIVGGNV